VLSSHVRIRLPLPRHGLRSKAGRARQAIVDKRRSAHNVSEVMNVIGDVRGKVAVLVDDMIDTAGARRSLWLLWMRAPGAPAALRMIAHAGRVREGRRASALPRMCGRPSWEVPRRLWQHQLGCEPASAGQNAGGDRLRRARGAGTITNAARVLHAEGAREVYACATHAVFSPPAAERLSSGVFQEVAPAALPRSVRSALRARARRLGGQHPQGTFISDICACIPAPSKALAHHALC